MRFDHVQELRTTANAAFVHYLQHFPLIFEIFGHFDKSALVDGSDEFMDERTQGNCEVCCSPSAKYKRKHKF